MATKKSRRKAKKLRQRAGTGPDQLEENPSFDGESDDDGVPPASASEDPAVPLQEFRMGQGASTSPSDEGGDDEVVVGGGVGQDLFRLDLPSHPDSQKSKSNQELLPPQLAELSDHLLRRIQTDISFTHRSSDHSSIASVAAVPTAPRRLLLESSSLSSLPHFHPDDSPSGSSRNRTEPTTRSSSPSPSEEGQEVVHRGSALVIGPLPRKKSNHHFDDNDDGMDELSSIDTTTGADVGLTDDDEERHLSPSPTPRGAAMMSSQAGFFEEKKDEDRTSGSEPGSRKSQRDAGAMSTEEAAEGNDDHDTIGTFGDVINASTSTIALTPARGPYHRRPSNEILSSTDSGFYTATQSSSEHARRASHDDGEGGDGGGARSALDGAGSCSTGTSSPAPLGSDPRTENPGTDPTGLVVLGYPPQPELEEDEEEVEDLAPERSDAEDRTDDAVYTGSSGSRSNLSRDSPSPLLRVSSPSPLSGPNRSPEANLVSLAPKSLRRRSEYDSVVASLHSSWTFESARIRLANRPATPLEGGDDSESVPTTGVVEGATKGPSPWQVDMMNRKTHRSNSTPQFHGIDEADTELSRAPATIAANLHDAVPTVALPLPDSAFNDAPGRSDTPPDDDADEPLLPAVEESPAVEGEGCTAMNTKRSMSDEEESDADEDPSVASNEGRPAEPHWLLRSERSEREDDDAQMSHPLDPNDDKEEALASHVADNLAFQRDDSQPETGGITYASPTDRRDGSGHRSAELDSAIESATSGDNLRSRVTPPETSPLVSSSSPDSEPGYVLLGSQSGFAQGNPEQSHTVEKTNSFDGEPPESAPGADLMNDASVDAERHEGDRANDYAINFEDKDRLSIPPLREDPKDEPRLASTDEVKQSFMDEHHDSASSYASSPTLSPATAKANAIAAAAAAIQGHLQKMETKPAESQKVVKTIQGSPTLAERKAALYTPRKAGKRDPETVLQLKERPLVAIESEDESDADEDDNDLSLLTPRQLDRSLTGNRSRSMASCDSRSVTSDNGPTSPTSPWPKNEPKPSPKVATAPALSLRDNLKRQDSEPVPRVVSKENETLSTLSTASLHTPSSTSSSMIFRTPLSLSKRLPSEPKRMSDLIRLDLWSRDPDVVELALSDLVKFAAESKNHGTMARTGGLLAVVRAMETHLESGGVQVQACRCLEKLALDHDNELAIGEVGGIEAILGAMMSHCDDCHVQEAAWAALWNLTCGNADNQLVVDAAGGIEVLVQCMVRHGDHAEVQKNACGTLANLCLDNEERLTALAEAGGFVAISAALQRHWKNPDVRNEASYAMSILLGPRAESYDVPVAHAPQQNQNIDA